MGGREGGLKWWIVVQEKVGARRMNTPMLIGDGTSVLMYVFLVRCAPRLPPPLFTGPLARPDLCHHHPPPPPPYKHFPLHHSQSGKRGRARAAARERGEREREKEGESRLPSPRMQINTQRFTFRVLPYCEATASEVPIGRRGSHSSRLNRVRAGNLGHVRLLRPEAKPALRGGWWRWRWGGGGGHKVAREAVRARERRSFRRQNGNREPQSASSSEIKETPVNDVTQKKTNTTTFQQCCKMSPVLLWVCIHA